MALKDREKVCCNVSIGLWNELRKVSKEKHIPISRLVDVAIMDLLIKLEKEILNPLKVIGTLQREISPILLKSHYAETSAITEGKREVILSLYLVEGNDE